MQELTFDEVLLEMEDLGKLITYQDSVEKNIRRREAKLGYKLTEERKNLENELEILNKRMSEFKARLIEWSGKGKDEKNKSDDDIYNILNEFISKW